MARDLELLEAGRPAVRVYTWPEPWVTLGRNQSPEKVLVDPARTKWIHRPTGGGAVLHGHDVTVGLVLPLTLGTVKDTYRFVTAPLVDALRSLGVDCGIAADLGVPRLGGMAGDCFAMTSANDIADRSTRAKVVGCALRRTRTAVLLQASIPVQTPRVDPGHIIRGGSTTSLTPISADDLLAHLVERLG